MPKSKGPDETITSNCHVQTAFPPNRLETAEHLSKLTGQTTIIKEQVTRNRVVLFGGYGLISGNYYGGLDDTWEWNGINWVFRSDTGPPRRCRHTIVYDSARRETVLFGGSQLLPNPILADTWSWDGVTWNMRSSTGPPARTLHAMVYDSLREQSVMFGGQNENYVPKSDTWTLDLAEPGILEQPIDAVVRVGATAHFSVQAAGLLPLIYQWRRAMIPLSDGGNIAGTRRV